jgi:hypothetical protein
MNKNMRSNTFTSLLMFFLTIAANFISLCPASQSTTGEVHLSLVSCTGHECNRNQETHSCTQEECKHDFCNDKFIIESCSVSQQDHYCFSTPSVPVIIADASLPVNPTITPSSFNLPVSFSQLRTPLRI